MTALDTLQDVIALCNSFEDDPDLFSQIVDKGQAALGCTQEDLADLFQVAPSTVSRWAADKTKPHPAIQKYVVGKFQERSQALFEKKKPKQSVWSSTSSSPRIPPVSMVAKGYGD